jgi:hypothetical protein
VEVFSMEMVAVAALGIGTALGLQFRVFVLLPAVVVGVTVITVSALAQGATLGSIAVLNVVGATCLQFGYLSGALMASLTAAGRFAGTKGARSERPFAR